MMEAWSEGKPVAVNSRLPRHRCCRPGMRRRMGGAVRRNNGRGSSEELDRLSPGRAVCGWGAGGADYAHRTSDWEKVMDRVKVFGGEAHRKPRPPLVNEFGRRASDQPMPSEPRIRRRDLQQCHLDSGYGCASLDLASRSA